jgi:16S rRNA (cytosine967-C5)-methyltransferase
MKPRDFALLELDARRLPNWAEGALKSPKSTAPPADPRDLGLAENIVIGVVKNLLLLQHLIQHYSGRNLKSLDAVVQKILAIGLYQLRFLDRVPASAVVDEAVEQTRRFGESRASGFVNAVLRNATRDPEVALPGRESAAEYARLVLSHPAELFEKLRGLLGVEDALRFCEHDQSEAPTIVRLIGVEERQAGRPHHNNQMGLLAAELAVDSVTLTPHQEAGMFVVAGAKRSTFADWSARGVAQVQDPTAAMVVSHLDVREGQVVLDRCCGLGTKSLQMLELVGHGGRVVAMDSAEARCQGFGRLIEQRKIQNVSVHCASRMESVSGVLPQQFDRALLDVPCSNSGVLARRAEARYAQDRRALASLVKLQDQILDDTAPFIKKWGQMVYSTCSVWPEENSERVNTFLKRHVEFELLASQSTLPSLDLDPSRYRDGGFWAVLRRI